jgi:AraC-like DNA-binding protein
MKATLEDIRSEKGTSSFYTYRFEVPYFEFKWHYHPEYELTYIIKGSGYRLVGNSYAYFCAGDLVLLGSNLPHTWSGKVDAEESSEAIVIQFSKEFMDPFLQLEEGKAIKQLLEQANRGLHFEDHTTLTDRLIDLTNATGMDRVVNLISILELLSQQSAKPIASNSFHTVASPKSELRINKVCLFIQHNFTNKIALKEVADLLYMTESNFCKFFKKATGKTYSDYVNEIRINEASRLLVQSEKSINQISYACGFETLSYFNRVFFRKKGTTPTVFRKDNLR